MIYNKEQSPKFSAVDQISMASAKSVSKTNKELVHEIDNKNSITAKAAWYAWFVSSLFYAYQYILRVLPNVTLQDVLKQFSIQEDIFGQFSGVYYLGYCLMHIPIGIALDSFGPRRVMTWCILLTSIGLLPLIFTDHWTYALIGRFIIGGGSSAAILGVFKVIRIAFPERYFARMLSFAVTIGLLGAIYGGFPVSYLCMSYSYKTVVTILICVGIGFAFVTYILTPEIVGDTIHSNISSNTNETNNNKNCIWSGILSVLTNGKVLILCILAALLVGPLEGFADVWGAEFLKVVYNVTPHNASSFTSMIYLGMLFGPALTRIAEKSGRYIATIAGASVVMFVLFTSLNFTLLKFESHSALIPIALFIIGICCAYQILAIYKASTYVPENMTGFATAVANMVIMSFGYVFHSAIGLVTKACGGIGSALALECGMSVISIALGVGTIGFIVLAVVQKD